ncbi:hypothetical protein BOX15_Mlig010170g3 [Macrostomum lignano]|uniref:Uncharacterized protein n=1 Tax=Macrostomum lignano TaxID=282301 RepID=A0A267G2X2_9PLAT|nr:hypothetical protein BOX15_Mlig010170g3 [Macrostomum lignano]
MRLSQVVFLCSLLLLLTSAQSPPGPRRLLRCPAEFAVLVEPLPDKPDVQPVLTTGPGVRLQTVRFLRDSKLRLDSTGRLWLSGGTSSGPHFVLCSDTQHHGLATFSLFVSHQPPGDLSLSSSSLQADRFLVDGKTTKIALAAVGVLAAVLTAALACAAGLRDRRVRSQSARPYRDFRHFTAAASRAQKLPV